MPAIKKILVPIDFNEGSEKAVTYAVDLARSLQASITVMNAYEYPVYGFPDGALVATAEVAAQISQGSQEALDAAVSRLKDSGVTVDKVLREGLPWEEIVKVATEGKADLIVMGTHGRHGLARAFLGSVAERVLRTATCPVLVIREPHPK